MTLRFISTATLYLILLGHPSTGLAEEAIRLEPSAPQSSWEYSLSPYLWACELEGDIGIGNAVAGVDLPFEDILDYLDVATFINLEARRGRWAFMIDALWIQLETSAPTQGILFGDGHLKVEVGRTSSQISYRILDGNSSLDFLAGISTFHFSSSMELQPGLLPGTNVSTKEDWWDLVIGFHLSCPFHERWFAHLRSEVGGFGIGSDLTWQSTTGVGYQMTEHISAFMGYRHLMIDYNRNNFLYETDTSGLFIGLNIHF